MTDRGGVLVSVRGEARRTVAPDSALISGVVAVTRASKADATRAAAAALDELTAAVSVQITVRALDLLDVLAARLAAHDALTVHQVSWHVDWDNPAWPQVRAAAIRDAIAKGRDYAAALGGELSVVEHIADPGFLAGDGQRWASTSFMSSGGAEGSDAPSLDPVPQILTALIEARFIAAGITLASEKQMQN
jgi:uncharacterized protein YggE